MSDPQERLLESVINKRTYTEKLVNHNVDFKKWKIKKLYKDTLWVKLVDSPDAELVQVGSIVVRSDNTKGPYRFAEVIMIGPDVENAVVGDIVMFPNGTGQPAHRSHEGYKTHFIREDAVTAVLEFEGTDSEMQKDIEAQLLLPDI